MQSDRIIHTGPHKKPVRSGRKNKENFFVRYWNETIFRCGASEAPHRRPICIFAKNGAPQNSRLRPQKNYQINRTINRFSRCSTVFLTSIHRLTSESTSWLSRIPRRCHIHPFKTPSLITPTTIINSRLLHLPTQLVRTNWNLIAILSYCYTGEQQSWTVRSGNVLDQHRPAGLIRQRCTNGRQTFSCARIRFIQDKPNVGAFQEFKDFFSTKNGLKP